jgi:hypothetical protein
MASHTMMKALGNRSAIQPARAQPKRAFAPAATMIRRSIQSNVCLPRCAPAVRIGRSALHVTNVAAPAKPDAAPALPWQTAMSEVKKRRDIKSIMIIGAGPIVIGQV